MVARLVVFIERGALVNYIFEGVSGDYKGLNDWIVYVTNGK